MTTTSRARRSISALLEIVWLPEFLLRWSHVTQDTRDGEARLIPTGQGKYTSVGGSTLPESGRYRLHIEPVGDAWRLVSPIVKLESLGSVEIEPAAFAVPGVTS